MEIGKADSDELFDYYEYEITVGSDCVLYHFKVVNGQDSCIYNRLGVTDDDRSCFDFAIIPGFHTPDWAKGAVMYQIFVDRFCNGDESNDVQTCEYVYIGRPVNRVEDWGKNPTTMDAVSYTHLDVYKRQGSHLRTCGPGAGTVWDAGRTQPGSALWNPGGPGV